MPEILELLERARRELLDLSTRNRLLSAPVNSKSARVIQVQDELAPEVFRRLVRERKAFSFLPGSTSGPAEPLRAPGEDSTAGQRDEDEIGLPPPDETEDEATGLAKRHVDCRLQTSLSPEGLYRRLLDLYRDALTTVEETGVNVLYLGLGQLKWFEAEQPETPRFAPLVLVPVELFRQNASDRFHLKAREEDGEENLSLRAKLHADFGLTLPEFPDPEELDLERYFQAVTQAVAGEPTWQVLPNAILLGFFSFAKLLMYRDLDPDHWPADRPLLERPFVSQLLGGGFPPADPPIPEDTALDQLIPVERLDHVVDADGSQTLAIEMVRQGRSLVIQGPPGTGKSQSITNLIATAVLDGKRVLFVAEKLAALEVVKRRLEREGLGELCLELHSNKASKRAVLEEIGNTWTLGRPRSDALEQVLSELEAHRSKLNSHVQTLHAVHPATGLTPFRVLGELVRLGDQGLAGAQLDLVGAETWDGAARGQREQLVMALAERLQQMGLPSQHPWRGVRRETVLQIDLPPLTSLMRSAAEKLATVQATGRALAATLRLAEPADLTAASRLAVLTEQMERAPVVDRQALAAGAWTAGWEQLSQLLSAGERWAKASSTLDSAVTPAAWGKDFEPLRACFVARGRSWWRFLSGEYRRAMREWRGVLKGKLPGRFEARLALLDELVAGQGALRAVSAANELGAAAFGQIWRAERSDWVHLRRVLEWVRDQQAAGRGEDFRRTFAALEDVPAACALGTRLRGELQAAQEVVGRLCAELKLDLAGAFGVGTLEAIPFREWEARLSLWLRNPEALSRWIQYYVRACQGQQLGLGPLVEGLSGGAIPANAAGAAFRRACHARILREMTRLNPELACFDGESHGQTVRAFQKLDQDRLTLAKYRVLAAHHERMPNRHAGVGAVGIVNGELGRKRGHRPVRKLLLDAGSVVQAIKPVFMMSPLSVAQFLAPGAVEFDLLVVDEASQVQPVDALGAIARCKQIVVVGDRRQLPPTHFFARLTSEETAGDDAIEGAAQAQETESILQLCCARGLPEAMLRWHYRSRHHSLIAVSNQEFYENRLFIVPSPYAATSELGLHFRQVPDGVFDSGGTGTNRVEAKTICRAVIEHARRRPNLTLGVAAFSVRQQQAILDELELLRRENPDTEPFFNGHPDEPFFVKNLENVQGDERDVILISIGYGRDLNGSLAMRFGPLANEGGERRLNVLISRARQRCEVFASITAEDIDLERAQGQGVRSLKAFLQFAQTGRLSAAHRTEREADSPFEEAVRAALEAQGHSIHPQVGVAGFFVDLAVVDRERPGRYVLGIECDGAAYHSSRSARDRDRLRQAVLEDHGWIIHRLWSTDWFQRPAEQLQRAIAAIERARSTGADTRRRETLEREALEAEISREEEPAAEVPPTGLAAEAYQTASFSPPRGREPHELSAKEMVDVLFRIVQAEGPIHEDEVVVRVKDLWGLQRAGSRIQDLVAKGIRSLLVGKRCIREDDCLAVPDAPIRIRNREKATSPGLRKPELLPPAEVRAAILALLEAAHGVRPPELPTALARLLGFKTTTATLRELVQRQLRKLEQTGQVREVNGFWQRLST